MKLGEGGRVLDRDRELAGVGGGRGGKKLRMGGKELG